MSRPPRGHLRWLTLAYASTLMLLVAAADRGTLKVSYLTVLPAADKIGHFLLMGLMSYLINSALGGQRLSWRRLSVLKGSAFLSLLVAAEELSQLWLTHRNFELADLAADAAGIWLFGRLARPGPRQPSHEPGTCKPQDV